MTAHRARTVLLVVLAAALALPAAAGSAASPAEASAKVAPLVLRQTAGGGTASFLAVLSSQADLSGAAALPTKEAKGSFVYATLRTHADRTQAPVTALLDEMGASYRSHFLVNLLTVTGDRKVVDALAARSDVASIEPNVWMKSSILAFGPERRSPDRSPGAVEWNVQRVRAPRAWRMGYLGRGIVLGDIDTGEQWNHPALKRQYRGWNGTTANHNFNWWDATSAGSQVPVDPNGHGTHTAGTMVGDDGGTNQIGVAPRARWIGCRSMNASGFGTSDTYITCFEFMIAPWDLNGQNPDPAKAPVAVNNSWYCAIGVEEGCTQGVLYQTVVNVRAAGIVPVVAAGNTGPSCQTIGADGPPAQYDQSYTVGATTFANTLASFSSRGPATFLGQRIKPDIVAPGDGVRSSYPTSTYTVFSGTSMATPHITGVIALIYSAKPELIGDVDATEELINGTAVHIDSSSCSSTGSYPNNLYGWGFVNAEAAVSPP